MKYTNSLRFIGLCVCCILLLAGCNTTAKSTTISTKETTSAPLRNSSDILSDNDTSMDTETARKDSPTMTKTDTKVLSNKFDNTKPIIALTFDDGPNTTTTLDVLALLEKYQITASFFVVGNNIDDTTSSVIKKAFDMGCEIQNHSLTHSDMTTLDAATILDEITCTSEKIYGITEIYPTFFRPPYIAVNQLLLDTVDLNFINGFGANDWDNNYSAGERVNMVLTQARDGAIILLHDSQGNTQTVDALDTIIPALLDEGYQFVTISELFELKHITLTTDTDIIYSYAEQTTMY